MREDSLEIRTRAAIARRRPLQRCTDALRIVHGRGDALAGLCVERFASHLLVRYQPRLWKDRLEEVSAALRGDLEGVRGILVQPTQRDGRKRTPARLLWGEEIPADLQVVENGLRYRALIGRGASSGLFLDMRDQRRDFAPRCRGRRVLNLFCYTGSFGVAALAAGARELLSVDISRPYLEIARENLVLNGLEQHPARWLREDATALVARLVRRGERFGAVICDPPTFGRAGRRRGRVFSAEKDYPALAAAVLALLEPGGQALFATNCARLAPPEFSALIASAAARSGIAAQCEPRPGASPIDFPPAPDEAAALKVIYARRGD